MVKRLTSILLSLAIPVSAAAPPLAKCDNGGFTAQTACGCNLTSETVGTLVVVTLYTQSTTISGVGITDGAGGNTWHVIGPINGTGNSSFIGWMVVTNSFGSFSWNWTGSTAGDCSGANYTNMAAVGTVADCNSAGSSGNSTSLTSGACTPTAANDVIVSVGGSLANSITYTAGGTSTMAIEQQNAHSSQGNSYAWEDGNATTCVANTATLTASGSAAQWSMIMAAFKTSSPTSCSAPPQGGLLFLKGGPAVIHGGSVTIK